MPLAADNPTDRVTQLIILTDRLSDLIERETRLLEDHRPIEIKALQDERTKLSNIYMQEMQLISKDKGSIAGVKQELTELLKQKTSKFRERLSIHGRVLSRIRSVTEGIIHAIARDINEQAQSKLGYGKDAAAGTGAQYKPAALTLDETI